MSTDYDELGAMFSGIADDPNETPERRATARRGLKAWLDDYRPSYCLHPTGNAAGRQRHTGDLALRSDAEYDGWGSER